MPKTHQDRMFTLAPPKGWLQAFSEPGQVGYVAFSALEKMIRFERKKSEETWQELLILIWRLQDHMHRLTSQIPHEEAMIILSHMPTELALQVGRQSFPGSWAVLLEPKSERKRLPDKRCLELSELATKILPTNDLSMLESYRHERGILDYLKAVEVDEEREIYQASRSDALIHKIRPPFYRVFELEKNQLEVVFRMFPLQDWAIALFNTNRDDRNRFREVTSDKQWMLVIETLKTIDQNRPEREVFSAIRERIGTAVADLTANIDEVVTSPKNVKGEPRLEVSHEQTTSKAA